MLFVSFSTLCHGRTQQDGCHLETRKKLSTELSHVGTLMADLPASRAVEKSISIVSATQSMVSCYSSWSRLRWELNQDSHPGKASSKTHTLLYITVSSNENGAWILKIRNAVSVKTEVGG